MLERHIIQSANDFVQFWLPAFWDWTWGFCWSESRELDDHVRMAYFYNACRIVGCGRVLQTD